MALVDASSVPQVLDASVVDGLANRLIEISNTVQTSFSGAQTRWHGLRDVFDVAGANGIYSVLDRPGNDVESFTTALLEARNALWDAASLTLPGLKTRRTELLERIGAVNADGDAAQEAYSAADAAYWREWRLDAESERTTWARGQRIEAQQAVTQAEEAGAALREDIERFRRDVEDAEDGIASALNRVSGGTDVHGAWGEPVRVSQTFWGFIDSPYPGAPASITQSLSLSEYLQDALSDAVVSRITWLGSADPEAAEDWIADHADFTSAVGLLEHERAQRLWEGLVADSTPHGGLDNAGQGWDGGALAQLFAVSPLVVGNLNGIPARQRDLFNRAGLTDLLGAGALDDDARSEIRAVRRALGTGDSTLLSLFIDSNGEPRAVIGYGDLETSDMIVTVTHGIETDVEQIPAWAATTQDVRRDVKWEMERRGTHADVASVAYFGWDSGTTGTVFGLDHADAGAASYTELVAGLAQRNPDALRAGWFHSYGTTMAGQALTDDPELLDAAFWFGSAGISDDAVAMLPDAPSYGLDVYASHADKDWTAPLGRNGLLGSAHTTNPGDVLDEEHRLGANGGIVDFGPGADGAYRRVDGLPTDGHASHTGDPWYEWTGEEIGYFDERAQSYLGGIDGLADMLTGAR